MVVLTLFNTEHPTKGTTMTTTEDVPIPTPEDRRDLIASYGLGEIRIRHDVPEDLDEVLIAICAELHAMRTEIRTDQLDGLRCGSMLREPGGVKEDVIHIWSRRGHEIARVTPEHMRCNDGDGEVFRSVFPLGEMPTDPIGKWACTTMTVGGQLVGVRKFTVVRLDGKPVEEPPSAPRDAGPDAAPRADAGADAPSASP